MDLAFKELIKYSAISTVIRQVVQEKLKIKDTDYDHVAFRPTSNGFAIEFKLQPIEGICHTANSATRTCQPTISPNATAAGSSTRPAKPQSALNVANQ